MTRGTVLVEYHVLLLFPCEHSWNIMFDEWLQNIVNIVLRIIDFYPFRNDADICLSVVLTLANHTSWCKCVTFYELHF